jgi:bacteriocin resistance YdeI/OmpD-like protein
LRESLKKRTPGGGSLRLSKESAQQTVVIRATVERKQADLPRFAVVPASALAAWGLDGTTVVEVYVNDAPAARRTLKEWDAERWFISVTEEDCRRHGVNTGDEIKLTLRRAPEDLPEELAELLRAEEAARAAWERLTPSQRRMLREEVASAKQTATRARRARKLLLGE